MKHRLAVLASSLLLGLPLSALARDAFTVDDVALQAGPDEEYPTITRLPAGAEVAVQGCIDGWTWCDVIADGDRGWVPASYLEEEYNNQRVLLIDYGPRIGVPVVSFSVGSYWGRHYHDRPWYHERARWESRHIRPRALPRPNTAWHGGAELRAHADVRYGDHRHGDANRNDANRGDWNHRDWNHRDANQRDDRSAAAERYRNDAERSRQTAESAQRQQRDAQAAGAARASQQQNATQQTQTAAQSDARANVPQYELDGALSPSRRMPPQVQTARNNTAPATDATQNPQGGQHQQHARDHRHDNGEHRGDRNDGNDKDRNDRDHDRG